jgi:hypothetical protein
MGNKEVEAFLTHLAVERKVSASTQNQALNALVFLYKKVLKSPLKDMGLESGRSDPGAFKFTWGILHYGFPSLWERDEIIRMPESQSKRCRFRVEWAGGPGREVGYGQEDDPSCFAGTTAANPDGKSANQA